jgi:hypothetical protein
MHIHGPFISNELLPHFGNHDTVGVDIESFSYHIRTTNVTQARYKWDQVRIQRCSIFSAENPETFGDMYLADSRELIQQPPCFLFLFTNLFRCKTIVSFVAYT